MDIQSLLGILFAAGTLQLAVATATPIALGAYAGLFSERSGVVNIGIEGMMLTAAMAAAFASAYTGTVFWGIIAALLAGGLMAALHAVLSIRFKMNQIISGTVINFLAWGIDRPLVPGLPGSAQLARLGGYSAEDRYPTAFQATLRRPDSLPTGTYRPGDVGPDSDHPLRYLLYTLGIANEVDWRTS
jgi:ABC-type uncharacterized transport system permease subunit